MFMGFLPHWLFMGLSSVGTVFAIGSVLKPGAGGSTTRRATSYACITHIRRLSEKHYAIQLH